MELQDKADKTQGISVGMNLLYNIYFNEQTSKFLLFIKLR